MLPNITLNNCQIIINVSPQGFKTEIKPNEPQLQSKPLQLESREPIWLSCSEASSEFGLSMAFFANLARQHTELSDVNNVRIWLDQEKVREYLNANPQHKLHSLSMKRLINVPMLTEKAYRFLRESNKEMYPNISRVPTARRAAYASYAELSRLLGVSEAFFYKKIRTALSDYLKTKPDETDLKRRQDEEMERCVRSWKEVSKKRRKIEG